MFTHFNPDHFEFRLSASILNAGDVVRLQEQTDDEKNKVTWLANVFAKLPATFLDQKHRDLITDKMQIYI